MSSKDERLARLEAEKVLSEEHIAELDARAVLRDEQIVTLVKEIDGLTIAAKNRGVIEQAKGVIMKTMQCGPEAAFAVLVAQSQNENRKLAEIAAELAALQDRS